MIREKLTESECYLLALLTDESGIDHAEFAMIDETAMEPVTDEFGNPVLDEEGNTLIQRSDGVFRAFPFQYSWWRTKKKKQIDAAGRSVGKSLSIKLRAFAFPFLHQGEEMVITAPGDNHLQLVTDNIDALYRGCRLAREMLVNAGVGNGAVTHKPFMANFQNGGRIVGRIPHLDGKNIKGSTLPDALVLTRDRGYVEMQHVTTDDLVWSHERKWDKVLDTYTVEATGWTVKGQGALPLQVSHDHRFYVRNDVSQQPGKTKRQLGSFKWEWADGLTESRYCPVNAYWTACNDFGAPIPIELPDYTGCKSSYPVNEDFWWVVGRYIADGSLNGGSAVQLSAHPKDHSAIAQRFASLGMDWKVVSRSHSSADSINIYNAGLVRWLSEQFGHHSHHKSLPTWCFTMDPKWRQALLDGYLSGDGAEFMNHGQACDGIGTASKNLALSLGTLAQTLGYNVGYSKAEINVTHVMGTPPKNPAQPSYRCRLTKSGHGLTDQPGYVSYKMRSSEKVDEFDTYYGIVTESGSYFAEGVYHHNTHPLWLEMDEASDYPPAGWKEIVETVKIQNPDARWRAHGVTRGVGDDFDKKIKGEDKTWFIHRLPAMFRPNWTDKERHDKIEEYGGSVDSVDYRRNVLGLPGDESSPMFVMNRITQNIDEDEHSHYNTNEYYNLYIDDAQLGEVESPIDLLEFPILHHNYENFWVGMDVGWTQSPSVIVVFAEVKTAKRGKRKDDNTSLKLLTKIALKRVKPEDQVTVMLEVIDFYRPQAFAMDATGSGFPLYGWIQKEVRQRSDLKYLLGRVKNYDFGSKIIVGFDDTVKVNTNKRDAWEEAAVKRPFIEASTDAMRMLIDDGRMPMPLDYELIGELQAIPKNVTKIKVDEYGRSGRKTGMHILDAMRLASLAFQQKLIDRMIADHKKIWRAPKMITIG